MIIDVSSKHNVQSKKYDYVRIAFILSNVGEPIPANQINYYFNHLFSQTYCNTQRIAQIMRQKKHLFTIINTDESMIYNFEGKLILNKTTQINWNRKGSKFFRTP